MNLYNGGQMHGSQPPLLYNVFTSLASCYQFCSKFSLPPRCFSHQPSLPIDLPTNQEIPLLLCTQFLLNPFLLSLQFKYGTQRVDSSNSQAVQRKRLLFTIHMTHCWLWRPHRTHGSATYISSYEYSCGSGSATCIYNMELQQHYFILQRVTQNKNVFSDAHRLRPRMFLHQRPLVRKL